MIDNLVGRRGIFREQDSDLWKKYDGKTAVILEVDMRKETVYIQVEFEDGFELGIIGEEFDLI